MKTVTDTFSARFLSFGASPDETFDSGLLGRIGEDLRHLYEEAGTDEVPRALLDMAEMIDARRTGDRHGE